MSNALIFLMLFAGLAIGNYAAAALFSLPMATANERSFFQAVALIAAFFVTRFAP